MGIKKHQPFPVASHLVQEKMERKAMEIHKERLAGVTAVVDSSEPEHADRLNGPCGKKAEMESERRFEIEAENARMAQKLLAIEKLDSSQVIRPDTSRSSISNANGRPGVFRSQNGLQVVDHINLTACCSPRSIHYRGSLNGVSPMELSRSRTQSRATGSDIFDDSEDGSRRSSGDPFHRSSTTPLSRDPRAFSLDGGLSDSEPGMFGDSKSSLLRMNASPMRSRRNLNDAKEGSRMSRSGYLSPSCPRSNTTGIAIPEPGVEGESISPYLQQSFSSPTSSIAGRGFAPGLQRTQTDNTGERRERVMSVYYGGANLVNKGGRVMPARRSQPYSGSPTGSPRHQMASPRHHMASPRMTGNDLDAVPAA